MRLSATPSVQQRPDLHQPDDEVDEHEPFGACEFFHGVLFGDTPIFENHHRIFYVGFFRG
jgi:hypothetical protein